MNQYFNDKSSIFLTEVNFDTSEENQLSYFQNGLFFKILAELFTNTFFEITFVTFVSNKSLVLTYFEIISFPIPSEIGIGPTSHSDSGSAIPE